MVSSTKTCTIVTGVWRMRLIHLLIEFQYSSVRCTNNVSFTVNLPATTSGPKIAFYDT